MGRHNQWQFSLRVESLSDSSSEEDEPSPVAQPLPSQRDAVRGPAAARAKPRLSQAETSKNDFWYAGGKKAKVEEGVSEVKGGDGGKEDEEWDVVREIEEQENRERVERELRVRAGKLWTVVLIRYDFLVLN